MGQDNSSSRSEQPGKRSKKWHKQPQSSKSSKGSKKAQQNTPQKEATFYHVYHAVYYPNSANTNFLFVEKGHDGGDAHQITGSDAVRHYEAIESQRPDVMCPNFNKMTWLGTVEKENYTRFGYLCEQIPPPRKEGTVWMNSYEGEPMKSTEQWTEAVIKLLVADRILDP